MKDLGVVEKIHYMQTFLIGMKLVQSATRGLSPYNLLFSLHAAKMLC